MAAAYDELLRIADETSATAETLRGLEPTLDALAGVDVGAITDMVTDMQDIAGSLGSFGDIPLDGYADFNVDFDFDMGQITQYNPPLAVEQSRLTINSMAQTTRDNLLLSLKLLDEFSEDGARKVEQTEDVIDLYEDKLGTYLVKLGTNELNRKQNEAVSKYLHTLTDFERIGDHAMNIAETARERHEKKIVFSGEAGRELAVLTAALRRILDIAVTCFVEEDVDAAYRVEPLEEWIDVLVDTMKLNHVERLQKGNCSLTQGFVFNDLLGDFERVADHCSNIALALIELQSDEFDTHGYILDLKERRSHDFDRLYRQYSEEFRLET